MVHRTKLPTDFNEKKSLQGGFTREGGGGGVGVGVRGRC